MSSASRACWWVRVSSDNKESVFLVLFQLLDAPVDGGDVFLFDFEETLRLQQVIYGRNEVGVLVLPRQYARKRGQVTNLPISGLHHQYSEHLPPT